MAENKLKKVKITVLKVTYKFTFTSTAVDFSAAVLL